MKENKPKTHDKTTFCIIVNLYLKSKNFLFYKNNERKKIVFFSPFDIFALR